MFTSLAHNGSGVRLTGLYQWRAVCLPAHHIASRVGSYACRVSIRYFSTNEYLHLPTRICPLCEAACSLTLEIEAGAVLSCSGNQQDTFSRGHVCPKGLALPELHTDPDRLRQPLVRDGDKLVPASWADAFERINEGLNGVRDQFGDDAVATYLGNPTVHNFGLLSGYGVAARTLGSRNLFSAASVDQLPKQLACELMFGNGDAVPVPDIERADLLLILGANPLVSNGSLWIVPGIRKKLAALRQRGGQWVVIDPRLTESARAANESHLIRPGTDAWLLAALCNRLIAAGRKPVVPSHGFDNLRQAITPITTGAAAHHTGLAEAAIEHLAELLLQAKKPVVYGRIGTTLQRFGTLTSFLLEVVNVLTGALDQPGGAMFPEQAYVPPRKSPGPPAFNRFQSRVSGHPEVLGQLPVACLREEIETPGAGQIRALLCISGNPVVSNPEGERLARALGTLDFMVAFDCYLNETTRHADVIVPGTSPLEDSHYDSFLGSMAWRNTARYSPTLIAREDQMDEWRMMLGMAHVLATRSVASDRELDAYEDDVVAGAVDRYVRDSQSPLWGRDPQEIMAGITPARGAERLLDLGIRAGPWGDAFGSRPGLSLRDLVNAPDSIDRGPLRQRLSEVVGHRDGRLSLAPAQIIDDLGRLQSTPPVAGLVLIGRRNIQTNNSWLHNLPALAKGRNRCVLEMHEADARDHGVADNEAVVLRSSAGEVRVVVSLSTSIVRGVVCMPHGFSMEDKPGQRVAQTRRGANSNMVAPVDHVDVLSGASALNGIPVTVTKAPLDASVTQQA